MISNSNPYSPWGGEGERCPKEFILYCRITCLRLGGDPGDRFDMMSALAQVSYDFPWMQRGHLHPDYLSRTAHSYCQAWNNMPQEKRNIVLECFESCR